MNEVQFEFNFTDPTILEADGEFDEVNRLMIKDFPHQKDWMVSSWLTIDSQFGLATMSLHFMSDKKIFITQYTPSVGDVYYNPDISALSEWSQSKGWLVPEPIKEIIRENIDFWKHYWETLLIDSTYLDDIFGKREHAKPNWKPKIEKDEEDESKEDKSIVS